MGRINVTTEMQGVGFDDIVNHQRQVADIIAIRHAGGRATSAAIADASTSTRRAPNGADADEIIASLDRRWRRCRHACSQPAQPINLGGQQNARSPYQFTLQTPTPRVLLGAAARRQDSSAPGLEDVSSDLQVKNPRFASTDPTRSRRSD
jgi:hypothetical protein